MEKHINIKSFKNQRGVSLIEVLVSMFLLGIAVIGFVALQVRAMSATGESLYRSQAMSIAQEVSERVRANYAQLAAYKVANSWTVTPNEDCYVATCTAAELVDFDIRLAKETAVATLPNGNVAARTCEGASNLCVYVSWNKTTTASSGTNACVNSSGVYVDAPDCVMLEVY